MLYKELTYDGEDCVAHIKGIQFCIMGPEEIRKRSVAEITKSETYSINEPVMNGPFDPRMGVIDNNKLCKTCEQRNTFCPGHFGHIELARPLFYIQFFGIVQKLLRCVCFRCSKLLVDRQDPAAVALLSKKYSRQKRWEHMHKLCSNVKRCGKETIDGCGARQPDRVSKTDALKILMEWRDLGEGAAAGGGPGGEDAAGAAGSSVRRQVFGADDVLRILRRITDEDAEALGFSPAFNRPEWMVCTVLPVPPPCVRPSVRNDTGVRKEDDLTHKLLDIIKYNNLVKSKLDKGASYDNVEWHVAALQQHVACLIDNSGSFVSVCVRTGRTFRTICDRLNRKEGRIRGNLLGKRVDFSARTVITPDPNISIDELGVPLRIAMNLTFPEVVNEHNVEHMYRLVRNGPDAYPGAKHIRKGNRTIRLKGNDLGAIVLEPGDVVERHLCNGDYVLFNRQPSLHKMSMMAHRVRVMPHNTFRLNVCVCASYNADFDGDEMNMHVPQSLQSHEEIVQLAAVPLHVISPRHSKPIISIVQDVALGVFRITQGHVSVDRKQLFNLVCSNPLFAGALPPPGSSADGGRWTGRQLLSTIIPPTTMLSMYPDRKPDEPGFDAGDHHIRVRCGRLESGVLTTKAFNDPARGFIRSIFNEGGPDMVAMFLNNTQKLICDWLVLSGFSVGISDLVAPAYKRERIRQQLAEMHAGVEKKIAALHAGDMKNVSTLSNRAFFESQIDSVTKTCISAVEKVALGDIDVRTNRMLNMIKSGSKGAAINFVQMLGCLGQQMIDGQRIPDGFEHRTLPHFTKYDDGPQSRGFVEHSFVEGLTPQEFFFHSMAGRVGLIDTAVRTSETGYIQRKLVTFMQDLKVHTDLSVRNSAGQIVQFLYGEDGTDATKVEYQILPIVELDVAQLRGEHLLLHMQELLPFVTEAVARRPLSQARMRAHFDKIVLDREAAIRIKKLRMESEVMHPVNISIMVARAAELAEAHGAAGPSDLHPDDVLDVIDGLVRDLAISPSVGCTKYMQMLLRCHLSPKSLIARRRFTRAILAAVVQQIRTRFFESIAHPGEMVGILAAQSIGEPTTQTTLNTFHLAGVGAASITTQQGVPRLQELFHVSKNIKTPYMKIFVREPWNTDMTRCLDVCSTVQTTRFADVVRESKVFYDPPGQAESNITEDRDLLRAYRRYTAATDPQCPQESPWVLRLVFDRTKMLELQVCMLDLETVLRDFYDDTITCVFSDDNAAALVTRVRLTLKDIDANDLLTELKALEENILQSVVIKGVRNIEKAVPVKPIDELVYDPMTSAFVKRSEWAIETSGTNLTDVLALPHVDPVRTYTNDINEVNHVLGIEAARQALFNELLAVMWTKDSNSVNYRHMALLVDAMTSRGFLTSVNRHGINKGDIGPLAKCSFERTTEMLIHAGVFAELDRINGVAANIMLGQVAPCGTGDSEILIDEAALLAQGHEVALPAAAASRSNAAAPGRAPAAGTGQRAPAQAPQMPAYKPLDGAHGAGSSPAKVEADELEIVYSRVE